MKLSKSSARYGLFWFFLPVDKGARRDFRSRLFDLHPAHAQRRSRRNIDPLKVAADLWQRTRDQPYHKLKAEPSTVLAPPQAQPKAERG